MSDVTKATTYNVFADIGDGKLYLMQVLPTLHEAQTLACAAMAHDNPSLNLDGTNCVPLIEVVIVRTYMEECERIDAEAAAEWVRSQEIVEANENTIAFPIKP